jgi:hypothetical protein
MNHLYFGDNLKWLSDRKEFPDTSVDLVPTITSSCVSVVSAAAASQ